MCIDRYTVRFLAAFPCNRDHSANQVCVCLWHMKTSENHTRLLHETNKHIDPGRLKISIQNTIKAYFDDWIHSVPLVLLASVVKSMEPRQVKQRWQRWPFGWVIKTDFVLLLRISRRASRGWSWLLRPEVEPRLTLNFYQCINTCEFISHTFFTITSYGFCWICFNTHS